MAHLSNTTPAITCEDLIGFISDVHKDVYGRRPTLDRFYRMDEPALRAVLEALRRQGKRDRVW